MLSKGTSERFRWSLPLWGSILLNQLSVMAGRYHTPRDLRAVLFCCSLALLVPAVWSIVMKKQLSEVKYTPLDYCLYAAIFCGAIVLITFNWVNHA
jgi:hypothetical protein